MEKPAIKMRSSIACARCRKSKVKCLNSGVNTPCNACKASGRECTYPPPAVPGNRGGWTSSNGPQMVQQMGAQVGLGTPGRSQTIPVTNSPATMNYGVAGVASVEKSRARPKKLIAAFQHTIPGSTGLNDGSSRPLSEALDPNVLTPAVWAGIYDELTRHFPHFPIVHRPTFLRPLTEAPVSESSAIQSPYTPTANSTSTTPPPPPSPFLLLAILTLTARFNDTLIAHHGTTPVNTSEYYASALRLRLLTFSTGDDDGLFTPSVAKVQSLIMLAVHELGGSQGEKSWIWLGIAVRMCQLLGLPADVPKTSKGWIEEESERRTWWAVVMLDRMLSSSSGGSGRAYAFGWDRVREIPLPCSERAWLFGERVKAGVLDTPILVGTQVNLPALTPGSDKTENGLAKSAGEREHEDEPLDETGVDESVHARLIRLVDVWGRVCQYLCHPERSHSSYDTLIQELERWKAELPKSLSYTPKNLSAHISTNTSSSYALLHILYFLSIMLLHRESLAALASAEPPSMPNRCFSAARKITEIAREMHTWLSLPLTPIVCFAVYCTAWVGIYGLHHPQMTGPPGNGMGSGDARHLLVVVESWRTKWPVAEGWVRALAAVHIFLGRSKRAAGEPEGKGSSRKRRRVGEDESVAVGTNADLSDAVVEAPASDEMRTFDRTLKDFLSLSIGATGTSSSRDTPQRNPKRPRSNVAESVGGGSDTEMGNSTTISMPYSPRSNGDRAVEPTVSIAPETDRWTAVNTASRSDMAGRGLHGLVAAAQAGHQQLSPRPSTASPVLQDLPTLAAVPPPPVPQAPSSHPDILNPQNTSPAERFNPYLESTQARQNGQYYNPTAPNPPQSSGWHTYDPTRNSSNPSDPSGHPPQAIISSDTSIGQTNLAPSKADSISDFSDHEREPYNFEGWGKQGIARVDLVGFCEGNPWRQWGAGEDGWYVIGRE